MALDRFTWFGLALALLGWVLLIADAALSSITVSAGSLALSAVIRSDLFTIAETTIFSGFALAILGVLRGGFGALHRFFDAVLERANAPKPAAAPVVQAEPIVVEPVIDVPPPPARDVTEPRSARGRNYTILPNGAVEVDTLLGTRVFASMDEARAYIR